MNPNRVDSVVDLLYDLLIAVSVGLILVVGTTTGVTFGFGVLVSFVIHVAWKMARFDPEWMTSVQETG
jgi:sterol desaturase/sphingolipid hydroxylase (fatty acid hydroxylase superfamily)